MTEVLKLNERCALEILRQLEAGEEPTWAENDVFYPRFGKVAAGYFWTCGCSKCVENPHIEGVGPFKTQRQAERNCEETILGPDTVIKKAGNPKDKN
jgi:hypothetical protein